MESLWSAKFAARNPHNQRECMSQKSDEESQQPIDAAALTQQAYQQLREGRLEEAAETFSIALAVDPKYLQALRGRGFAHSQLERWSLAVADFTIARDLAPDDPESWVDLGMSLAMDDQVYPAINALETSLARHPDHLRGHLELGRLYLRLGAIPKARQVFQKALACRPNLEQRRLIEGILREQDQLDRKRYYRPDFEALHQRQRQAQSLRGVGQVLRDFLKRIWPSKE